MQVYVRNIDSRAGVMKGSTERSGSSEDTEARRKRGDVKREDTERGGNQNIREEEGSDRKVNE